MLIGFGLALYSTTMPAYTNLAEKEEWDSAASKHMSDSRFDKFKNEYYIEVSKLCTKKNDIMDIGTGITLFAVTFLLFSLLFKISHSRDLFVVRSPRRWVIFLVSNIAWLGFIPSNFLYYILKQQRGDYPWFADTIAIPIFSSAIIIIVLLPILNLIIAAFAYHSRHPAPLFSRFPKYTFSAVFIEIFFGFFLIIITLGLFEMVMSGDIIGTPICMILFYVFMSLRAGKVKWKTVNVFRVKL